jgi:4-diphosphocytidyl-2-C-methyl-D-erythritol kinase
MTNLSLLAPAKINLTLNITGRRLDGYHTLQSLVVFAEDIADKLTFSPNTTHKHLLSVTGPFASALAISYQDTSDNLVLKASHLLAKHFNITQGIHIQLEKNLPFGAGLGGGSSDAAMCLKGLLSFWNIKCSDDELASLALQLGADVPVCLFQKPCIMSGIGEIITPLTALPELHILLIHPKIHTATKDVFNQLNLSKATSHTAPDIKLHFSSKEELIAHLTTCSNDLFEAAATLHPELIDIHTILKQLPNCDYAAMTGSGSAFFALFPDAIAAQESARTLQYQHENWWVVSGHSANVYANK